MYSAQLLKGTYETIILQALSGEDAMYGYQLTQAVRQSSDGEIEITPGSLYPLLNKLQERGLVTSYSRSFGKRPRKYYSLTSEGRDAARDQTEEFLRFARTMITLLTPGVD